MNLFKLTRDDGTIKMSSYTNGELFAKPERIFYIITDEPNSDGFTLECDTIDYVSETIFINSSLVTQINGLYYYSCGHQVIKRINLGDTDFSPSPPGNGVPADVGIILKYESVSTVSLPIAQIGWPSWDGSFEQYYENGPDQSIDIDWGDGEVQTIQKGQEGIITKNWPTPDNRTIKITGYLVSYGNELGLESAIKESNRNITDLSISGMDTLENLSNAFRDCFKLKNVNLTGFKSPSLKTCHNMFSVSSGYVFQYTDSGWPLDKQGKITKIDPALPIPALEYIDISQMNFLRVTSYFGLFAGQYSLKTVIGAEKLFFRYGNEFAHAIFMANTANRPNPGGIFEDCHSLSDLDLSKLGFWGGTGESYTSAVGFDGDETDVDCTYDAECEVLSNWNASFMKDPAKRPISNSGLLFRNPDSEFQNNDDDYIELKFDSESLSFNNSININLDIHYISSTNTKALIDWGDGGGFEEYVDLQGVHVTHTYLSDQILNYSDRKTIIPNDNSISCEIGTISNPNGRSLIFGFNDSDFEVPQDTTIHPTLKIYPYPGAWFTEFEVALTKIPKAGINASLGLFYGNNTFYAQTITKESDTLYSAIMLAGDTTYPTKTVLIKGDISHFSCDQVSYAKIVGMRSMESAFEMFKTSGLAEPRLKGVDLSQWDSRNIVNISRMFWGQDIYLLADPDFTPPVPWSFTPRSYTQVYQYDYVNGQDWATSTDVSGDGQYFIIGSPQNENIPSTDTTFGPGGFPIGNSQEGVGVTQVFKKDSNNNWNQLGVDIPGTGQEDLSGYSVSISNTGNYIATGAPGYSSQQGMVRVYEYTNNTWTRVGQDIIGPSQNFEFGQYLVLNSDGSKLVVCDNQNLFVYSYENGTWNQLGNTIPFIGMSRVGLANLNSAGDRVVFSDNGRLRFLELQNGAWVSLSQIDIEEVVAINDNADIFAVKSSSSITIYEYKDNSLTQIGSNSLSVDNTIRYVKLSSDGRRVAIKTDYTGDYGGTYIYDFAETKNKWYLAIEELEASFAGTVASPFDRSGELGLSDDGNTLVTAGRTAEGPIIDRGESQASSKTQTNSTPVFIWNALPGAIEYEVKLNGVVMGTQTNLSYTASSLTNGTHTFEVRAKDSIGNYSNWSDYAIKIDTSQAGEDQPALIATSRGINGGFVFNLTPRDTTLDGPYTPTVLPHVKFDALDSFSSTKLLDCKQLFYKAKLGGVTIDLEHLDVSKVRDMSQMFRDMWAGWDSSPYPHETSPATEIKVSTWRPINLSPGMELFQCWCIPPDLKNWDTPHLKHMIFNGRPDYKSEFSDQIRANCPTSWNVGNSNHFVPHWFNWSD